MNKRTFIKLSSGLAMAPFLSPFKALAFQDKLKNWAGNLQYSTANVYSPRSVEDVQQLVKKYDKVKALGSRHCFNDIADSRHRLISIKEMNKVVALDADARTVTIEGGMNYGQLCPYLNDRGFALHNLASLPHISVAGACTTATHGSGMKNGNLATAVKAIEFVTADGTIMYLSKDKDAEKFNAAVVALGAIGIITKVTLALQPAYTMRQYVYVGMPLQQLKNNFEKIMSAGYSVSLFTDWQNESINEVWVKTLSDNAKQHEGNREFFGAKAATENIHPIIELSAENCTEQLGVQGAWYERLPHFKMGFTPSSGKELQAEYFVPKQHAVDAIMAIQKMGREVGPHLFISEVRTIAADDLWMSPCYGQDSVTIHFTWKQDWPAVRKLLPKIENELTPYGVKPHWGKLFTVPATTLASRYPKLPEFKKLVAEYDPKGKFRNDYLSKNIYGV
jgi:xylitol oxidase